MALSTGVPLDHTHSHKVVIASYYLVVLVSSFDLRCVLDKVRSPGSPVDAEAPVTLSINWLVSVVSVSSACQPYISNDMKLFLTASFAVLYLYAQITIAANSFSGANNYYAYNLPQTDRPALLDGMQAAGMKVRIIHATYSLMDGCNRIGIISRSSEPGSLVSGPARRTVTILESMISNTMESGSTMIQCSTRSISSWSVRPLLVSAFELTPSLLWRLGRCAC